MANLFRTDITIPGINYSKPATTYSIDSKSEFGKFFIPKDIGLGVKPLNLGVDYSSVFSSGSSGGEDATQSNPEPTTRPYIWKYQ
jgi:hypothetical protein